MRVAIISSNESEGGAASSAYRLIAGLRASGVDVDHFVERKDRPDSLAIPYTAGSVVGELANDVVKRVKSSQGAGWRRYRRRKAQRALRALLASGRYDVINVHGFNQWADPGLDRAFIASLAEISPLVWTLHDVWPLTGSRDFGGTQEEVGRLVQDGMRATDGRALSGLGSRLAWVGPSRWMQHLATQADGGRMEAEVIPYGVDTAVFRPIPKSAARAIWGIPEDVPVICALAQQLHAPRKGMDILLQAVARIQQPVQLLLAGNNRGLSIPANLSVCVVNAIHDERLLRSFYAAADVVAVPSREDNLPNVMLEALACGVPVIGSRVGGIPDAVRPGETGWLAESDNVDSWAVVLDVATSEARHDSEEWRNRTRRIAERDYSLDVQATRYRALFERMIDCRP